MNRRGFFGLFLGLLAIRAKEPRVVGGGPNDIHPSWVWEAAQEMALKRPNIPLAIDSPNGRYEICWVPE
jgi:hypothetical protein